MNEVTIRFDAENLEFLYRKYNKKQFVFPDPLQFLYNYERLEDREIVGLIASALAYGRVDLILKAISYVLNIVKAPRSYLYEKSAAEIERDFSAFSHRFTKGRCFSKFLITIKEILQTYGSIRECFMSFLKESDPTLIGALEGFSSLFRDCKEGTWCIVPDPKKNSPLKRMNLYLRWMVRRDEVDPGGWEGVGPHRLIIPLDVHMFEFAKENALVRQKSPSLSVALEITQRFKSISPTDPVKYDFVITRFGIWHNSKKSKRILNG